MSALDRTAAYFKARPNVWISAIDLMRIGGLLSFRTRVSELRRYHAMDIENRVRCEGKQRFSEYRWKVTP